MLAWVAPSLVHDMHDLGYSMSERTVGRMLKHRGFRSKIGRKYKDTSFAYSPST